MVVHIQLIQITMVGVEKEQWAMKILVLKPIIVEVLVEVLVLVVLVAVSQVVDEHCSMNPDEEKKTPLLTSVWNRWNTMEVEIFSKDICFFLSHLRMLIEEETYQLQMQIFSFEKTGWCSFSREENQVRLLM